MLITGLRLRNFCQHRHLDAKFAGLTGIIGPMGSGKTNILAALKVGILGDYSLLDGKREDNVTFGAGEKAASSIEVDFVSAHRPTETLTVHRGLSPRRYWLKCGAELLAQGDREVTRYIETWLGLKVDVINEQFFADQGKIAETILGGQPIERFRALCRLFGLDRLDEIRTAVERRCSEVLQPNEAELRCNFLVVQRSDLEKRVKDLKYAGAGVDLKAMVLEHDNLTSRIHVYGERSRLLAGVDEATRKRDATLPELAAFDIAHPEVDAGYDVAQLRK